MSNEGLPKGFVTDPELVKAHQTALVKSGATAFNTQAAVTVEVLARPNGLWTNAGVHKDKGYAMSVVFVSGSWKPNSLWTESCGAAGNPKFPNAPASYLCPGRPEGCLVAKFDGDQNGGGSKAFEVGNFLVLAPDAVGDLWLSVNDEPRGFGDNTGSLTVSIGIA